MAEVGRSDSPFESIAATAHRARLASLPFTILCRITSYLPVRDCLALSLTCGALLTPSESQIYSSLDLLLYPLEAGHHVDPALAKSGHRATAGLIAQARALGGVVLSDYHHGIENDLLQGGLRFFARRFNATPERRRWVREVYIDCSHLAKERKDEVARTVRSIGILRAVKKLTIVVTKRWEDGMGMMMECTPNIERLNLVIVRGGVFTARRDDEGPMSLQLANEKLRSGPLTSPTEPPLRHLAVEGMHESLERLVARQIGSTKPLESLALMDWDGRWRLIDVGSPLSRRPAQLKSNAELIDALNRARGIKTMILPKILLDRLKVKQLRNTLTLGVQGPNLPSMRFTDLDIPPLPRIRRLFFFTNRETTTLPRHSLDTTVKVGTALPAAKIPDTLAVALDAAPMLTDIHYVDLVNPTFSSRAEIRSFDGPKGTFTHVRAFSSQVCVEDKWARGQSGETFGVWQDWTCYQGHIVPVDILQEIYAAREPPSKPARRKSLPPTAWKALDTCIDSGHT